MLALTLTCLFAIATIATGLSLLDSWLRGRGAYIMLKRQQALLEAGFTPQLHAREVRLRQQPRKPARRTLAGVARPYTRQRPLYGAVPVTKLAS